MINEKYPNGKLNESDEGQTELFLGVENGAVIIKFNQPVSWVGITPDQAIKIANGLIAKARSIGTQKIVKIELGK